MNKKSYIIPEIEEIDLEMDEELLAGSAPVKANGMGDGEKFEYSDEDDNLEEF